MGVNNKQIKELIKDVCVQMETSMQNKKRWTSSMLQGLWKASTNISNKLVRVLQEAFGKWSPAQPSTIVKTLYHLVLTCFRHLLIFLGLTLIILLMLTLTIGIGFFVLISALVYYIVELSTGVYQNQLKRRRRTSKVLEETLQHRRRCW